MDPQQRRERLEAARLYFAVEADPPGHALGELLEAALRGGVDVVQLRDKRASDDAILAAAAVFRAAADARGALFVLNDRPDLAAAAGADGVHVGQDDLPVAEVRERVGADFLVGLSTHGAAQFDAGIASAADYLSAGPVHATPTKEGRPATGIALIEHAAHAAGDTPWFAIGGVDARTAPALAAAGATRFVVVRAIRDATDPRSAAAELRAIAAP